MTTAMLDWDHFLVQSQSSDGIKSAIERYRNTEWPKLRRDLATRYSVEVPEHIEPHWVAPGRAVFWQREVVRTQHERVIDGATQWLFEDVDRGWQPSGYPRGYRTASASSLATFFKKGFRLRPPVDGVDDEAVESAVPEAQGVSTRVFTCKRHQKGKTEFPTWKAYIQHCSHYREAPQEAPPEDVLRRIKTYAYYCFLHDRGFGNQHLAQRHVQGERRKNGIHPSTDEMEVKD